MCVAWEDYVWKLNIKPLLTPVVTYVTDYGQGLDW
jgi:hypothetical protein